jgi:CDP-diglyceride synthetase
MLDNSNNVVRLILITFLAIYEVYAFKNRKPLKKKLLPIIFLISIGLLVIVLQPFLGLIGGIFAILLVELSLMCSMLVVLWEIILNLFSSQRNIKEVLKLVIMFSLIAVIFFLGEKVF